MNVHNTHHTYIKQELLLHVHCNIHVINVYTHIYVHVHVCRYIYTVLYIHVCILPTGPPKGAMATMLSTNLMFHFK